MVFVNFANAYGIQIGGTLWFYVVVICGYMTRDIILSVGCCVLLTVSLLVYILETLTIR